MIIDYLFLFTTLLSRTTISSQINGLTGESITLNGTYDNVTHLINSMLRTYDIRLRPNFGEKALVLDLEIAVASFDAVSEVNMDFTMTLYLYQYWKDERLAWLPSLRNESITLSGDFSQKIWVPDTFLANDKSSYLHDVTETNKMLKLYSDGYVSYGMRFTSTLACKMDLRSFPLDRQNFSIEIESYGYTTDDLFMRWRNGRKSIRGVMDTDIPQFRILNYEALNRIETTDTGKYQRLSLVLILRRSVGYYMFQTYFPSTLIVALSWISFWINHEATAARVALGVTTVLTMTTISTGVRASLPRISYIKAIDIYLVICFVFVFAALLEYAAVNYTYWGSTRSSKGSRRQSSTRTEVLYPGRRKLTSTIKEFPTWDMYVKNEEEDPASMELCQRRRRQSQNEDLDRDERKLRNVAESEEMDDSWKTPLGPQFNETSSAFNRNRQFRISDRSRNSGRVSPIPVLLQQQRQLRGRSPQEFPSIYDSEILPSSSEIGMPDRHSMPKDALPFESSLRRRAPNLTPTISGDSYEDQDLQNFEDFSKPENKRRGTHPSQRHCVTFGVRRTRSSGSFHRSSITQSNRSISQSVNRLLQSRHTSLSLTKHEFVTSLRRKAKAMRSVLPRIQDVNVIDKWSRAMFPLSFIIFNFVYWCYYVFSDWKD